MNTLTLGTLCRALSQISGIPEPTLRAIARELQLAGLLPVGRRGRGNGAQLSPQNVAAMVTAILTGAPRSQVAEAVAEVMNLPGRQVRYDLVTADDLSEQGGPLAEETGDTFGEALTAIIAGAGRERLGLPSGNLRGILVTPTVDGRWTAVYQYTVPCSSGMVAVSAYYHADAELMPYQAPRILKGTAVDALAGLLPALPCDPSVAGSATR